MFAKSLEILNRPIPRRVSTHSFKQFCRFRHSGMIPYAVSLRKLWAMQPHPSRLHQTWCTTVALHRTTTCITLLHMSNLSIRNLPPEVERAIAREARKHNTTKTEIVVNALQLAFLGKPKKPRVRRDIRGFFGHLSKADFAAFEKATSAFGKIDPADWQ
jgi:hypothetical protein